MSRFAVFAIAALLFLSSAPASAATITFFTDPFAGSTALTTPGRQVVAGEPSIAFIPGVDQFQFDLAAFGPYGVGPNILFANDVVGNIPGTNVNTIVLRTFDDDANLATPFGAGNAANLIAGQLTAPTPGFFIYFNQGLGLPRLVFSTNLDDNTADLKILARMTNLTGPGGQAAMENFTAANFATITTVPEPSSMLLLTSGGALLAFLRRRRGGRTSPDA
jgi:PEP-CTERM motif